MPTAHGAQWLKARSCHLLQLLISEMFRPAVFQQGGSFQVFKKNLNAKLILTHFTKQRYKVLRLYYQLIAEKFYLIPLSKSKSQ